jgi:hypothetical protein
MVLHTHRGALTLREEMPDNVLIQNNNPDPGAGGAAAEERARVPLKDKSLWEQFLHYLLPALGAWPV